MSNLSRAWAYKIWYLESSSYNVKQEIVGKHKFSAISSNTQMDEC